MSGVRRLEHVEIRVRDLPSAASFYEDVLGFVEIDRDDGAVYFGCGLDGNVDLIVVEGGTGLGHFAIRTGEESLDEYAARIEEEGVSVIDAGGSVPGQENGIRFDLPSGRLSAAIVDVDDGRYHNPANATSLPTATPPHPDRSPIAPIDLSHVTAMSPDIEADVAFLRDVLGLRVSDVGRSPGDDWIMAFLRSGDYHHDVAVFDDPENSLHHVAWEVEDVSQMIRLMDRVAASGVEFEAGPVRHGPGSNVAAYFKEPGGNRFEITTEVATVPPEATFEYHDVEAVPFSVWGGPAPVEGFREGT